MTKREQPEVDPAIANWRERHPYPRWCGVVTPSEYVIGKFTPGQYLNNMEVEYHGELEGKPDRSKLNRLCKRHLINVVRKHGGSNVGTVLVTNFTQLIYEQLGRKYPQCIMQR